MRRARSESGSTLVEILAALVIVSFGSLAVVSMFVTSLQTDAVSAERSAVNSRVTSRAELLRSVPFHQLAAGGSLTSNVSGYFDDTDPLAVLRWQIVDGGGPAGSKTVTVRAISLSQIPGAHAPVELTFLRSR